MEFLKHTLPNGLQIVAECNDAAYSTALGSSSTRVPAMKTTRWRGEPFLEHMVFKGTPTRSADDVNAGSTKWAPITTPHEPKRHGFLRRRTAGAPKPCGRSADRHPPAVTSRRRLRDRKAGDSRRDSDVRGPATVRGDDKCRALHFGSHPLGRSVLGTAESIGGLSSEAMGDYFRQRYSPGNIVFWPPRTDRLRRRWFRGVEGRCGQWAPGGHEPNGRGAAARDGFQVLYKETATQQYLLQIGRRLRSRRQRRLCRQAAGHRLGRRLGQPALLGIGRSRPRGTHQPQS